MLITNYTLKNLILKLYNEEENTKENKEQNKEEHKEQSKEEHKEQSKKENRDEDIYRILYNLADDFLEKKELSSTS